MSFSMVYYVVLVSGYIHLIASPKQVNFNEIFSQAPDRISHRAKIILPFRITHLHLYSLIYTLTTNRQSNPSQNKKRPARFLHTSYLAFTRRCDSELLG